MIELFKICAPIGRMGAVWMMITLLGGIVGCRSLPPPPRTGYVPPEEAGVMTVGLDDHDYDLVAEGVAREAFSRGLPKGYVVALGPVDTRDCPYDVRMVQLQKSLMVLFNKEGTLRFTIMDRAMQGDSALQESYKLMEYNWFHQNPIDAQDLYVFGQRAEINGILFGRVSSLERSLPQGGKEITYRFVWELANCKTGLLDIAHEKKIRKNIY